MRLAIVLTALHRRSSLQPGPIDAEWLLDSRSRYRLELFVDQSTEASEAVRRAGIPVFVALKRSVVGGDGTRESSDALAARQALRSHKTEAFDAILYGSDVGVDFAWFEPALRIVPRGVCLGAGAAHELRAIWQDRYLFGRLSRRCWSLAGWISSADFLVSDLEPDAFGLRDNGLLPPRYRLRDAPPAAAEPSPDHRAIAVLATSLGSRELESLMARLVEAFPPQSDTIFVVITRPSSPVGRSPDVLLLADCDESLRRQTVVVPTDDDGVAAGFLRSADVVVAGSMAELAIPGIADLVRESPWVCLEDVAHEKVAPDACGTLADALALGPSKPREAIEIQVLSWQDPHTRTARALESLGPEIGPDDLLLVHASGRAGPSVGLFGLSGLYGADVVVWGQPEPVLGLPDPDRLYPFAFAVRGELVPVLIRVIEETDSIWDVICWLTSSEWIDRLRLLLLPAPMDTECWEVRDVEVGAVCGVRCGVLPPARWLPVSVPASNLAAPPRPAVVPCLPFVQASDARPATSLVGWVRRTTWWRRVRVALPWRWGLLERAMKDQW